MNTAKQKLQKFANDVERVSIPKVFMRLYLNSDKTYRRKDREEQPDGNRHIRNESEAMYVSYPTFAKAPNLRSDCRSEMKSAKGRQIRPETTFVQVSYGGGGVRNGPMRPQTANARTQAPTLHTQERVRPVRAGMSEALQKNELDYNTSFMRKVEHSSNFYSDFGNIRIWQPNREPSIMTKVWDPP